MCEQSWEQIGTVELLELRIYPIDPYHVDYVRPLSTTVAVEPGTYPVYRKYDAFVWVMRGRVNERLPKIGDGLFEMNNSDRPTGVEVQFPSRSYGPDELRDFMADSLCQPGPQQRLRFDIQEQS